MAPKINPVFWGHFFFFLLITEPFFLLSKIRKFRGRKKTFSEKFRKEIEERRRRVKLIKNNIKNRDICESISQQRTKTTKKTLTV